MGTKTKYDYATLTMEEMEKSPCVKRKVGCIIVDEFGEVIGKGFNLNGDLTRPCEDHNGDTAMGVTHAEISALKDAEHTPRLMSESTPHIAYVTHKPCHNCNKALSEAGVKEVVIVKEGIKHDKNKPRLSLIPTQLIEGVGAVMTFGSKKYKKNNWKQLDDPSRYLDALWRHLEAYRGGEEFDTETGLSHMAHIATNAGFLMWMDEYKEGWQDKDLD